MVTFVVYPDSSFTEKEVDLLKNALLHIETVEDLRDLLRDLKKPVCMYEEDNDIIVLHPYDY